MTKRKVTLTQRDLRGAARLQRDIADPAGLAGISARMHGARVLHASPSDVESMFRAVSRNKLIRGLVACHREIGTGD